MSAESYVGPPRGTPLPLDLAALEHLFQMGGGATHYAGCELVHSMCAARALLAYARALRVALRRYDQAYHAVSFDERGDMHGWGRLQDCSNEAAAVLGAARDGPA